MELKIEKKKQNTMEHNYSSPLESSFRSSHELLIILKNYLMS